MTLPIASVAIVEDHTAFAQTLAQAVQDASDLELCAVLSDLDEAFELIEHSCPTLLLVDLGLPTGSGLGLLQQAKRRWDSACICAVLTITGNEAHLLKAIGVGAKGYLFKSDDANAWLDAMRTLLRGGALMHSGLARHLLQSSTVRLGDNCKNVLELLAAGYSYPEIAQRESITSSDVAATVARCYALVQDSNSHLSAREIELLDLLNQGHSFKQSAQQMGIQESTTKTLASRAYQKLGASNLQEALYAARREHLLR